MTKFKCGTLHFMAPEILNGEEHDFSIDIWSLGVMIYFLCRNIYPFGISPKDTKEIIKEKIIDKKKPSFCKNFPRPLGNLLIKMLEIDPKKRITAEKALKNSYFYKINVDSFQNEKSCSF